MMCEQSVCTITKSVYMYNYKIYHYMYMYLIVPYSWQCTCIFHVLPLYYMCFTLDLFYQEFIK